MPSTTLNEQFGVPGKLTFSTGHGGLIRAVIAADAAQGEIYLHGGHVTAWQPHGQEPVLWMSAQSWFEQDKPIRGGVPICFPWFGAKADDPAAPSHGTARLAEWDVQETGKTHDGGAFIRLGLALAPLHLSYTVAFGPSLKMTLKVTAANTPSSDVSFEEALHTYFNVSDVRQIRITGLEGVDYLDQLQGRARVPGSTEPITFDGEVDRVYTRTPVAIAIEDPGLDRRITVQATGSSTTVVWNPHLAKAARMPDFGDDEWPGMCCVETANAVTRPVTLEPGATHELSATISVA
jgi:D-hexose-6-phosphate mutarotase